MKNETDMNMLTSLFVAFMQEGNFFQTTRVLYNYLRQFIDFDYMSFHMNNLKTLYYTPLIIIDEEQTIPIYDTRSADTLFYPKELEKNTFYFEDIVVNNNLQFKKHLGGIHYVEDVKAIMGLPITKNKNYSYVFNLFSKNVDTFTTEYVEIMRTFRPIIQQIVEYHIEPQSMFHYARHYNEYQTAFDLIKNCKGLKSVIDEITGVAPTQCLVFIQGESGVGKELIAESIHLLSTRKHNSLVKVNCSSFTDSLLASELFGHEKGAFTGAASLHQGYFERAHKGTIFLDEVAELSMAAQAQLLRIIEQKELTRLGGHSVIQIDVRIIAATNKNIMQMVNDGTFREDLMYRLMVFPIEIPPLRNRKEDIPSLINYAYTKKVAELGITRPPKLLKSEIMKLILYDWPGNVRQLMHIVERALIIAHSKNEYKLNITLPQESKLAAKKQNENSSLDQHSSFDKQAATIIQEALIQCNGKIEGSFGAAKKLNLNPNTLRSKMRKLGLTASAKTYMKTNNSS